MDKLIKLKFIYYLFYYFIIQLIIFMVSLNYHHNNLNIDNIDPTHKIILLIIVFLGIYLFSLTLLLVTTITIIFIYSKYNRKYNIKFTHSKWKKIKFIELLKVLILFSFISLIETFCIMNFGNRLKITNFIFYSLYNIIISIYIFKKYDKSSAIVNFIFIELLAITSISIYNIYF